MDLELQHQPRDVRRHGHADATGVAQQDVALQVRQLVITNTLRGQGPETGVDAVMGVTVGQGFFDHHARRCHGTVVGPEGRHAGGQIAVQGGDSDWDGHGRGMRNYVVPGAGNQRLIMGRSTPRSLAVFTASS